LSETEPTTEAPEETAEAAPELPDEEPLTLAAPVMHRTLELDEPLQTLDVGRRIIGLKLLTYNQVVDSKYGPIMFEPGAFGQVDPPKVRLRMDHEDPPTGLGATFKDTPVAPLMDFKVSKTQRGDEQLTLAVDGVSRGASVGFDDVPGGPQFRTINNRRVTVYPPNSAVLAEVSTTWMPTFSEAGVMYVLKKDEKGPAPMGEAQEAAPVAAVDNGPVIREVTESIRKELAGRDSSTNEKIDKILGAFEEWRDQARAQFVVPQGEERKPKLHHWVETALTLMQGKPVSPTRLKELALDDIVTTDNPGAVPDRLVGDFDELISNDRPFLNTTLEIEPPETGTSMLLPVITQHAVAGTQYGGEKTEVTTTGTRVGTGTFPYQAVFGGADVSIQLLNRAGRSFFDLLTGDIAMAYALDEEAKAIAALLNGYTDSGTNSHVPVNGGVMDPEDPNFGEAWKNTIQVYKRAPNRIWMSADAVAAFIDAKAPITNAPLYSDLAASFTAGDGPGGRLSGLLPVYVPALDTAGVDVIIGPSRGFVWAEDPAKTLQVDVPSLAGRDIALVGGIFPAPRFADAFTYYTVAGS